MNILITGNMGYIGPVLARHLNKVMPEAKLTGYDMGYFAQCLTGASYLPEVRYAVQHFGDVRAPKPDLFEGVDAVIHLAAISNDPMGNQYEEVTLQVNHEASVQIAKLAKQAGVKRYVFASSCSTYGYAEGGPRREDADLNPLTAYARSKVYTERDLEKLANDDFVVTCLRFATACGMSDRLRLDLVLNDFVAGALVNKEITVLSDGTPWRPLIHVEDMSRAMEWALQRSEGEGGRFLAINAGSDEWNYQIGDLARAVAKEIPGVGVSINENAQPDKRSYQVDFGLYRKLAPNHQPQVDLGAAIMGLREGLEIMRFEDKEFRSSKLMRLKVLTSLRGSGVLDENLAWNV